jgi:GAF domain-containing protein/HAMP domain-containing protein
MAMTIRRKIIAGIAVTAVSLASVIILDHAVFDSIRRRSAASADLENTLLRAAETCASVGHVATHLDAVPPWSSAERGHFLDACRRLDRLLAEDRDRGKVPSPGAILAGSFSRLAGAASAAPEADPRDVAELRDAAVGAFDALEAEMLAERADLLALRRELANAGEHRATIHLAGHAIAFSFLFFVCWVMMATVLRPLRALHERIRRAEAGLPTDPLPALRDDELKPIIEGFNRMCSSLQARNDEIHVRSQRLAALAVISQAASSPTDLDRLLAEVLAESVRLMGNDVGLIRLVDHQTRRLRLAAVWGMWHGSERIPKETEIGQAITGLCVQVGEPIVAEDAALDPRMAPWLVSEEGVRSAVAVPLFSRGKTIGTLCVGARRNHHYRPDDISLLVTIGRFTAGGIDNLRLARETSDRAREVNVLLEMGRAIGTARDFDGLANRVLEILSRPFGADFGVLATVESPSRGIRVRGALGRRGEALRGTVIENDPASPVYRALTAGRSTAIPIPDGNEDPLRPLLESWGLRAGVLASIAHDGEVLGLILLGHARAQAQPDGGPVSLLTAAACEMAFVIHHDGLSQPHRKAA